MAYKDNARYPEDFKKKIVDLYNSGISVSKLSSEYGVFNQTIYKWIKLYSPTPLNDSKEFVSIQKYEELKQKNDQLEMENEILKKAAAIFARKQ